MGTVIDIVRTADRCIILVVQCLIQETIQLWVYSAGFKYIRESWFMSFLTSRKVLVSIHEHSLPYSNLWIHRVSTLGLTSGPQRNGISFHCCADETHLCLTVKSIDSTNLSNVKTNIKRNHWAKMQPSPPLVLNPSPWNQLWQTYVWYLILVVTQSFC